MIPFFTRTCVCVRTHEPLHRLDKKKSSATDDDLVAILLLDLIDAGNWTDEDLIPHASNRTEAFKSFLKLSA
jgi:hypothetical protein